MAIRAEIDTIIRIDEGLVPSDVIGEIKDALTIRNMDRVQARKERLADWNQMPEFIELWRYDALGRLVLPRGFLAPLVRGLRSCGHVLELDEGRTLVPMDPEYQADLLPIRLRDHQDPAVRSMLFHENGIYQAPPGSGKTVAILEAIRRTRQRSIILVDKGNIAEQWRDRIQQFLGVHSGLIGDGVWDPGEITVALKQTLWSRRQELRSDGFFDEWGFVAYDECHHVTAETYQYVIQQFPARYLIGVSATPKRISWTFPIAKALLGPIFHETPREQLQDSGILIQPKVVVVPTQFEFAFRSTKVNKGGYRVGNNYGAMMKELVEDANRNQRIIGLIKDNEYCHNLVVGKRLGHLERLEDMLAGAGYGFPIYRLTGAQNRSERGEIAALAEETPCTIFSTIADEALDIPRLDRLYLIWPTRNISVVRQQIGRVERAAEGKTSAKVYDIYDKLNGVLRSQFNERLTGVYKTEDMEVEYLEQ